VVSNFFAGAGRVVVVGQEPLLQALPSPNGHIQLHLYALPGTTNLIQSAATLSQGGPGFAVSSAFPNPITATNLVNLLTPIPATNRALFFRPVRQ
jgi:hypothetical protein